MPFISTDPWLHAWVLGIKVSEGKVLGLSTVRLPNHMQLLEPVSSPQAGIALLVELEGTVGGDIDRCIPRLCAVGAQQGESLAFATSSVYVESLLHDASLVIDAWGMQSQTHVRTEFTDVCSVPVARWADWLQFQIMHQVSVVDTPSLLNTYRAYEALHHAVMWLPMVDLPACSAWACLHDGVATPEQVQCQVAEGSWQEYNVGKWSLLGHAT